MIKSSTCLLSSISLAAVVLACPALAQSGSQPSQDASASTGKPSDSAPAHSASEDEKAIADIIVTGTLIRGVAPVGAPTIPLSRDDLLRTGSQSTTDILATVPQISSLGGNNFTATAGQSQQNSRINVVAGRATNLRGLGAVATLVLVDGLRPAPGQNYGGQSFFDTDTIPAIAIERVEIVADGSSAIYGSDAVAGVVNFILRRNFQGLEASTQYSFTDDVSQFRASVIGGHRWSTGSAMIAFEHYESQPLRAAAVSDLFNDDLRPFGLQAPPRQSFPGNIVVGGATFYPIPANQDGSNLQLGQLRAGTPNYTSYFYNTEVNPATKRNSVVGTLKQEIGSTITVDLDGFYSQRTFEQQRLNFVSSAVGLSVPSSNPFSPCNPAHSQVGNPGINCAANMSVLYNFTNDLGPTVFSGTVENFGGTAQVKADLFSDWRMDVSGGYYQNIDRSKITNEVNSTAISQALGNTVGGVAKPATLPYFNPFCGVTGPSCNAAATLDYIRAYEFNYAKLRRYEARAQAGGALFTLPGGAVRLAIGAEYRRDILNAIGGSSVGTASATTIVSSAGGNRRSVKSGYAELLVPIFGPDNARPFFQRLELSLAGRIEHYSDFGTTKNPKIGISWEPAKGLKLHGSYGTSFRAPSLAEFATNFGNRTTPNGFVGTQIGLNTTQTLSIINRGGGEAPLFPETAKTFSAGLDITPGLVPGLTASVNYYHISYTNIINSPPLIIGVAGALNSSPLYDRYITYNPAFYPTRATMSQADFNTFVTGLLTATYPPVTSAAPSVANVAAVVDGRNTNAGIVKAQGLDFSTRYRHPTGYGEWRVGVSGTYVLNWKVSPVPGAPLVEEANRFGYPLRFVARGEIGGAVGGLDASVFMNYRNKYKIDPTGLPTGAPAQYQSIDSYTTVDFNVTETFKADGFAKGLTLGVNVQNLFDRKPPLVLNGGLFPILFDPTNASPFGRIIAVSARVNF